MNIWKKLRRSDLSTAEIFLKKREEYCVSAISRFNSGIAKHVWAAYESDSGNSSVSALLLYGKRLLYPVFNFSSEKTAEFKESGLPLPLFFPHTLKSDPLHAIQGLAGDLDFLENALAKKGLFPASVYDYDLLNLDYSETNNVLVSLNFPLGLLIRKAETKDIEALFPLQAAYEKEEVLPDGVQFNPAACYRTVEAMVAEKTILIAVLDGNFAGKININAQSYNRFQIGGVYVLPEYRGRSIARAMTSALIREFAPQKNIFSLFVKKKNIPARRVYYSLGFNKISDYRISYY